MDAATLKPRWTSALLEHVREHAVTAVLLSLTLLVVLGLLAQV